jgi:hypothetical protein
MAAVAGALLHRSQEKFWMLTSNQRYLALRRNKLISHVLFLAIEERINKTIGLSTINIGALVNGCQPFCPL